MDDSFDSIATAQAPPATRALDLDRLDGDDIYKLLCTAVQPRPIAWVSTVDSRGVRNLAPFSFFTIASRHPATVMVSIGERIGHPGRPKDTLVNILETREFVVNIPAVGHAAAVTASFATVEPEIDEFDLAGVATAPAHRVSPPLVADALASLECVLADSVRIGTDTAVFGTVVAASVRPDAIDERLHSDPAARLWLSRLAGPYYSAVTHGVHQDEPFDPWTLG